MRILTAGIILLICQTARGETLRLTSGQYLRLWTVSVFLFMLSNFLISYGQKRVASGVSAILITTTPLWMGLFEMGWPGDERLSWRGWIGLAIGFVGIILTNLDGGFSLLDDFYALLILASAASWAMGSLVSRHMALTIPHFTSAGFQMLFGGIGQIALGSAIGEWQTVPEQLTVRAAICFLYLLVFGSLLGFVAFNWLLGHVPAAKVGTYAYVNPVIAISLGGSVGETVVDRYLITGIVVILVGVYLVRGDHAPTREIELEPD